MHIGYDIKASFFDIQVEGRPTTMDELLDWDERDRLGIVVDRAFGALDASLMILLAGNAFYDHAPQRRRRKLYPELFMFHAGGPWGMYTSYDFAPDHKEVRVSTEPSELLRAINHAGITHLLVPDRQPRTLVHRFKEPEAATDRIKKVFAYGPMTSGEAANVVVSTSNFAPMLSSMEWALQPHIVRDIIKASIASSPVATDPASSQAMERNERIRIVERLEQRKDEVPQDNPERIRHSSRMETAKAENALSEAYRTVDVATALNMLYVE